MRPEVVNMRTADEVNRGFEYAKALGVRLLIANPKPELLPLVNQKVQEYGMPVAIHNHGPEDKTYPTPQSVYEKVKELDRRIGLCIDVGHTKRAGVDPSQAARQCADRLMDIHIKDIATATPKAKELEIGRGILDIPEFLRTLDKIGYTGVVSFEFEKDADDPLPGLAESVGYVRGVLAAI